jgi:outer membrane protein TolC
VLAEVAAAVNEVEIRSRQLSGSLRALREDASTSARIAQAAYREGGADLLRLLDAERVNLEVQLLYQQALAQYRHSVVVLETALGTP